MALIGVDTYAYHRLLGDVREGEAASRDRLPDWFAAGAAAGVVLAVENHADLRAAQLARLGERIGSPRLAVCFDTANAVRVGDDVLAAADLLAPRIVMAHVKDVRPDGWRDRSGPVSVPLGAGVLPVRRVVERLRSGGAGAASGGLDLWLLVEFGHLGDRDVGERALVRADLRQLRAWEKEVSGPLFRSEQGLEKGS